MRFSAHIFPGETIKTEIWKAGDSLVQFRARVLERNTFAINNGYMVLHKTPPTESPSVSQADNQAGLIYDLLRKKLEKLGTGSAVELCRKVVSFHAF